MRLSDLFKSYYSNLTDQVETDSIDAIQLMRVNTKRLSFLVSTLNEQRTF